MEGKDMEFVSTNNDGAQYKFDPQEIERAQTQPEEYLNDFVSHPILPFQLGNLTSIFSRESQGGNFMHHSMIINVGEDVHEKIMSYFRAAPYSGILLSARGSLNKVTLNLSFRRITYEGMYNIVSLKGGYILADAKEEHKETQYMNIIFSAGDGTQIFGGPVVGSLIAATNVQATLLRFKSC